jgi:hypothetical protein
MAKNLKDRRDEMVRLVELWRSSGRPALSFAAEHGVSRSKFEYWKRRLAVPRSRGEKPPGFMPVRLVSSDPACEVVFANGDRLVLREAVSAEMLRGLIGALRGGC